MENLIVYLCNDKPVKPVKRVKPRKNTKKKVEPKEHDSTLNQDLKNDIKNLRFKLEDLKQEDQREEPKTEILTPRSKAKSEQLKKKMNFLKRSQSMYEYKKR